MTTRESLTTDAIRLISQFQPALLAYILTLHRNHTDAQDILQETNVVLWQKISLFQEGTSFKAWAFRIAYLQTLAHFKRIKRGRWLGFAPELIEMLAQESGPLLDDFEERHRALRACIDRLPEEDRKILGAYYQSGLPLADVSVRVGRSVGALKQVLLRLRRSLKMCIEGHVNRELIPTKYHD